MRTAILSQETYDLAETFKAMAHPVRLEVVRLLGETPELRATDIHENVGGKKTCSQSCISQHLSMLRRCGLVDIRRSKQNVFYTLASERIEEVKEALSGLKTA